MGYTITANEQFDSLEVIFDEKPSEAIRNALKALHFRWHRIKKCWYGFAEESKLREAIDNESTDENPMDNYTVETREGYMGAIAWDGNNAQLGLYGAELCKALREAFKKCKIKGVSVRKETYTGGQSIYFTITPEPGDLIPREDFIKQSNLIDFKHYGTWIQDPENNHESVLFDKALYEWDDEKKQRVVEILAGEEYDRTASGYNQINEHYIDDYKMFSDKFKAKLHTIRQISNSFNYDDSNSMVDYFDRGFYEHYRLKEAKS